MASLGHIKLILLAFIAVLVVVFGAVCAIWPSDAPEKVSDGRPEHVLIIGIDGMTARSFYLGDTRFMEELASGGAITTTAQAVVPTASGPNWGAMLMGAGPRHTQIAGNHWRLEDWDNAQFCEQGIGEPWPTIFDLVEDQIPDAKTLVIHHWIGIKRFFPRGAVDKRKYGIWGWRTVRHAKRVIRGGPPTLMFVHLDDVDGAGHDFGYDGWKYHREVDRADHDVRELMAVLDETGKRDETLVIVMSDHGGIGHAHGGDDPHETTIPIIFSGRGVAPGTVISTPVSITDIAPTVAWALGLEAPDCWTGRAVTEAFKPGVFAK